MHAKGIERSGMAQKARKGPFVLYTHLSWTGRLVLGDDGTPYEADVLDLCPELELGSVGIILNAESEIVVRARADHGEQDYLCPEVGERLLLVTARPLDFTPKTLDAIASAMVGGGELLGLPETQQANACHFIAMLHEIGIGTPSKCAL